jgi:cytochrome c peroxidase
VLKSPFNAIGEFSDDPECESADNVRYLANSPEMWGAFKTPSLRNVAQTAPYMRQGQFATLREVIHFYSTLEGAMPIGHHQETILVPLNLTESQIDDLVAFLESLTGQPLPEELTRQPDSPILQR